MSSTFLLEKLLFFGSVTFPLFDLGIPPNLLGFKYIELAILICVEDEDDHNGHLKRLYDEISKIYETSPGSVERCIRNAISMCWMQEKNKTIDYIFANMKGRPPTNSQFLTQMYYHIQRCRN